MPSIRAAALMQVSGSPFATATKPGIATDPNGCFAYVTILGYWKTACRSINATTGAITQLKGSPFGTDALPLASQSILWPSLPMASTMTLSNVSPYKMQSNEPLTNMLSTRSGANPSSVAVNATGKFVYVTNEGSEHCIRLRYK